MPNSAARIQHYSHTPFLFDALTEGCGSRTDPAHPVPSTRPLISFAVYFPPPSCLDSRRPVSEVSYCKHRTNIILAPPQIGLMRAFLHLREFSNSGPPPDSNDGLQSNHRKETNMKIFDRIDPSS